MRNPRGSVSRQGNYAGAISRLVAFAADVAIAWATLLFLVGVVSATITFLTGRSIDFRSLHLLAIVVVVVWSLIYFSYPWALSGKTVGMALFGLRVVTAEGGGIRSRQAVTRTLALPFSIAIAGLGLFGIVFRIDHRGWHDRLAGTCVVYDWDARAARLRWLARQHDLAEAGQSRSAQ